MDNDLKTKKSSKYLIIGTLVLFLSIIGASVAYYLARVQGTLSGRAAGTELELTITQLSTSADDDLIPLDNDLETLNLASLGYDNEGSTFDSTKACIDINGYSVCQIYRVRVTNNGSVPLTVNGTVEITGANTPNIDCVKMDDEINITNNASCMGQNVLASGDTLAANSHNDYFVMVYINNLDEPQYDSGDFNGTVTFTSIDGKKVKGRFKHEETLVEHITNLYNNAEKTVITANADGEMINNDWNVTETVNYNYATSVKLMNDRLGGITESLDGGNIRFYGSEPNNYINIGDKYGEDVIQRNWESYFAQFGGAPFSDTDGCLTYMQDNEVNDQEIEAVSNYTTVSDFCSITTIEAGTPILWRIIGVFGEKIKIIRDTSIGNYSWDTSASNVNYGYGINEWSQADLMKLLNPGYETNQDLNNSNEKITVNNSLWWNRGSGTCYNDYNNSTTSCDFTNTGLSEEAKEYVIDQTVYLGAHIPKNTKLFRLYANNVYISEHEKNVIQNPEDGVTRTLSWTGKVGLMQLSDFIYSIDLDKCKGTMIQSEYLNSNCSLNNWMNYYHSWTLTPIFNNSYSYSKIYFTPSSPYDMTATSMPIGNYPTLLLDPALIIESGNGAKETPYVISY